MLTRVSMLTWLAVFELVFGASGTRLRRRHSAPASSAGCAELQEEGNGTHYTVLVQVGTPGQSFSVVADTGSNSLIVPSCICKEKGYCGKDDRCFRGTNTSSTFIFDPVENGGAELLVTFGSGQIGGVVARDVADVGAVRANMSEGILLMVENALRIPGRFEGILGLGLPHAKNPEVLTEVAAVPVDSKQQTASADAAKTADIMKQLKKILGGGVGGNHFPREGPGRHQKVMNVSQPPSFLEQAHVDRFSMCFHSDGSGGLLQMGLPPLENALGNVGHDHWALDFRGISVGKGSKPSEARFCAAANKTQGMKTACGIIPDSGTTAIMGPKTQLVTLMGDLCDRWDRCRSNYTKMVDAADAAKTAASEIYGFDPFGYKPLNKATMFQVLLQDCQSWLGDGSLDELPPLLFHVAGEDGEEQSLEIPSSAYLVEQDVEEIDKNTADIHGLNRTSASKTGIRMAQTDGANETGVKRRACMASFGAMEYPTKLNGDVWILGVPLFSQYKVSYDLKWKNTGSMSFAKLDSAGCGSCAAAGASDKKVHGALLSSRSDRAHVTGVGHRQLRSVTGPFREPDIDVTRPL